jgi:drug/metabolite transporter (DMT)-like permease
MAKKWYKNWPKLLVTTISFYVGTITFALLSLAELQWSLSEFITVVTQELQHPVVLWAAGYMALFGSIIGLTAYIKGQDGIEASEASLFTYLQPLVYLPLGYVLLNEKLSWYQVAALGLITLGIWLSSWYNRPSLRIRARRRRTV